MKLNMNKEELRKFLLHAPQSSIIKYEENIHPVDILDVLRDYPKDKKDIFDHEYIDPIVKVKPKEAFYADKKKVLLRESEGLISGEFVMCYPPGIPILAPGELITKETIDYIEYSKKKGSLVTGPEDMEIEYINVLDC